MGADPSLDWNSVRGGFDESVDSTQEGVDEAEVNKTYWQNQDLLWASMYGNMESNVASYYDSLTSDGAASEMNQQTTAQITAAKTRSLQQLQDRGFSNSGMVAQTIANSNSSEAIMLANNAYTANKDVWKQKAAFMQGIALPQKQQNQSGLSAASSNVSAAYGSLAKAQNTRASAKLQVEQFNEAHSNDQINSVLGLGATLGGAYLGGGMGKAPKTKAPKTKAPNTIAPNIIAPQFQPIEYDVVKTQIDTRIT